MGLKNQATDEAAQQARAKYLDDALREERWTYRKLEARTGISKSVIASRLTGTTPLLMSEVEIFADVLRRNPVELFATLHAIPDADDPHPFVGAGQKLLEKDSNLQPAGLETAAETIGEVIPMRSYSARHQNHLASSHTAEVIFLHAAQ